MAEILGRNMSRVCDISECQTICVVVLVGQLEKTLIYHLGLFRLCSLEYGNVQNVTLNA